ncbi:MAG: hypothetical protein DRJ40_06235 [Thermoprotei archaeon]|nr:MAG: hypothetical protein DRJ40_06235 [Thermoprotei archaeon]
MPNRKEEEMWAWAVPVAYEMAMEEKERELEFMRELDRLRVGQGKQPKEDIDELTNQFIALIPTTIIMLILAIFVPFIVLPLCPLLFFLIYGLFYKPSKKHSIEEYKEKLKRI